MKGIDRIICKSAAYSGNVCDDKLSVIQCPITTVNMANPFNASIQSIRCCILAPPSQPM